MTGKNRQRRATNRKLLAQGFIAGSIALAGFFGGPLSAQTNPPATASQSPPPQLIEQAQTARLPIHVFSQTDATPIQDLQASDFNLTVDGKPHGYQLSRPWSHTINPKTGQADDRPNLLIIVPLASPLDRNDAINEAVSDLKKEPQLGWDISILDDSGNQTPYTRQMPMVIAELEKIGAENPAPTDLVSWRSTASLAIARMRDLPGRRVVMSLGDIFHEIVFQDGNLVYDAFDARDLSTAAINVGAVIYAAESSHDIGIVRRISPAYSVVGAGPWMLLARDGRLAGWISNSVSDTMQQIRRDGMAAYDMDLHLDPQQMDGLPHLVSVTTRRPKTVMSVPAYYIAPSLSQLQQLSKVSPALRQALKHAPSGASAPLQLTTQMEYFPHPDGKTGTQIFSTGLFWNKQTPPPAQVELAQQLQQINTGFVMGTIVGRMEWSFSGPAWNTAMEITPGTYRLRVAAADPTEKITGETTAHFTVVAPDPDETVRISSLVIGKACVFSPESPATGAQPPHPSQAQPQAMDYLRAGNCHLQLDPSHAYSPQDIVWTLVRITPVGKLAGRPAKDWKGNFRIVDANGSKLAEEPLRWLAAEDGSMVATTAFPLDNPKLKLVDGEYAVLLQLKGPGIESNYEEDAPFLIYGAGDAGHGKK